MHKSGNRQFRDTNSHEQKQEHWLFFVFFGNLVELFQAHIKVNNVFSQCHAGSSHGRGHSVGGSMPVTHKQTKKSNRSGGNKNAISDGYNTVVL